MIQRPRPQAFCQRWRGGTSSAYVLGVSEARGAVQVRANRAFVLGLLSLFVGVLGPPAVVLGWRSLRSIAASHGALGGEGRAAFGLVAGSISTTFLAVGVLHFLVALST